MLRDRSNSEPPDLMAALKKSLKRCDAHPPAPDKRTCQRPAGHDGKHRMSGVCQNGSHGTAAWSLTWKLAH